MVSRFGRFTSGDRDGPQGHEDPVRTATDTAHGEHTCNDPQERQLLLLYVLSGCLDDEALDFEAHLLGCEACFEDLKTLDRARVLVQESMAGDPAILERLRETLGSYRRSLGLSKSPPPRMP